MGNLSIKVSSGNVESYEALLLQFPEPASEAPIELVELNFGETSQIFPTALAVMAAYIGRARGPAKRTIISRKFGSNPLSAKLERAMDGFGFLPAVTGSKEVRAVPGMVPLIAIDARSEPDQVASRVLESVLAVAQPTRDMKETIFVLLTEMIENVIRHSGCASPAYLCGQLSAQKKKLEICLVDPGRGLRQVLADGKNSDAAERLKGGEPALRLAMELALSSGGEGNTGFGLFLAGEAVRLNRGIFRLTSGKETLFLSREGLKSRTHAEWHGTIVNFLFNLANTGPLADVYKTLGRAIAQGQDFFEPGGDRAQGASVVLKGEGPYVGSRRAAAAAREQLLALVRAGSRAIGDADGIAAMTPGFADECFGELLAAVGEAEFRRLVFLKNANDSTRLICEAVLGRRVRPADPNAPLPEPEPEPEPEEPVEEEVVEAAVAVAEPKAAISVPREPSLEEDAEAEAAALAAADEDDDDLREDDEDDDDDERGE